jgi:hypothetical protein
MMIPPEQNSVKSGSFRGQTAPNRVRLQPARGTGSLHCKNP